MKLQRYAEADRNSQPFVRTTQIKSSNFGRKRNKRRYYRRRMNSFGMCTEFSSSGLKANSPDWNYVASLLAVKHKLYTRQKKTNLIYYSVCTPIAKVRCQTQPSKKKFVRIHFIRPTPDRCSGENSKWTRASGTIRCPVRCRPLQFS